MAMPFVTDQDAERWSIEETFAALSSSRAGLSSDEVARRLQHYGQNQIEEEKTHPLLAFLSYFWGPIPWMIEAAAALSLIVRDFTDVAIIIVLLIFNATIGFWQEHQASNAVAALKRQLALQARVHRDGRWQDILARALVPGDIVIIRLGDVIPADVKLVEGSYLSVDQSVLTGESLPVEKRAGQVAYSGSAAKQGEMVALVAATGSRTYLARTAKLVEKAGAVSHFQKAVLTVGDYLIYLSLGLALVLIAGQLARAASLLRMFQFVLILVVAAIPVAMPAVLSVTMALGALALSKMKAIVSRLQSIEEMAGIDVLCSDKTGTLTQNKLTLGEPVCFAAASREELILTAVLASNQEHGDAIDEAVLGGLEQKEPLALYRQKQLVPFDPSSKRAEATIEDQQGHIFGVSKGAPQVIFELCALEGAERQRAERTVEELAAKGFRTLGVARRDLGSWQHLGILSLYDPPREDSADTIQQAVAHGVSVKMVTGDNRAIAREIARELKLGTDIVPASAMFGLDVEVETISPSLAAQVEEADGFAEVLPEHKYNIVRALQQRGHLVAMTGDGVNDAPALKQAEVGIAVSGATDAARAAAALVLTAPGLSVIINAIEHARQVFERMQSYAIYRIAETIRIMFFVVLTMLVFNFYPITTAMIILLALLNDLPIMAIAYDKTWLSPRPVRWEMRRVLGISTALGLLGVIETFLLLLIGIRWLELSGEALQSFIYLKLAVAGHLTLLVARTRKSFLSKPHPARTLLLAVIGTQAVAVLLVGFGILVPKLPWSLVGLVWAYCLVWVFIEDWFKLHLYRHLELTGKHHRHFLHRVGEPLLRQGRPIAPTGRS